MNLSLILFLIGILGFVLNRKNIILMLISIEIMLLATTFLILLSSLSLDDILGQTYAIYVITIVGGESTIGLGMVVVFNAFQAPKVRHYATFTDLPPNYSKPFSIIEIYLTKDELRNVDRFLSALENALIFDQHYSGVYGVINPNNKSVSYIWSELYLHFNYIQVPTFFKTIMYTMRGIDKTPLEVDVVLYLWPCSPGGLPYPNGPSVKHIISTHIFRHTG